MPLAYLGLGSNLGDRGRSLTDAVTELARAAVVVRTSSVYETAPWGRADQPVFLNCCVVAETDLAAAELLALAKDIEVRLGRGVRERWGPREIDIDLLLYGDRRIATPELIVPHPFLLDRAFALVPLAEVAPDAPIPGTGRTASEALAALSRTEGDVRRVAGPIAVAPRLSTPRAAP